MKKTWIGCVIVLSAACVQVDPKPSINPANCGNGELDTAELCDPEITEGPGICPTSCDFTGDACGGSTLAGSADECTARCVTESGTCGLDDGCCPDGCTRNQDSDCPVDCEDPANASSPGCAPNDRLADLDEQGWRAFCDSLTPGVRECSDGTTAEVPAGQDCYEGFGSVLDSCAATVGEARACLEDPCALFSESSACAPLLECATMQ